MSGTGTGKKRSPEELLRAIDQGESDADLAAIEALSESALDAGIRAQGGDPDAIARRGAALAEELLARRKRLGWQVKARADMEAARAKMATAPKTPPLPRSELLDRIEAARNDARLRAPVTAAFRKRGAEECSDDELRSLLDEIEMLRALEKP
jgi:hypothetical protein